MANHKSAMKRARTAERRNVVNQKTQSEIRTLEKKLIKAIADKDKEASGKALTTYTSRMAKAAQKGRIHVRTASRKVSRLSKRVASL